MSLARAPSTARLPLLSTLVAVLAACSLTDPLTEPFVKKAPITRQRVYSFPPGLLEKVAIMPFYPDFTASLEREQRNASPSEAADLMARFASEALSENGISTIPASDLANAFLARGIATPRLDPISAADVAAREFGASAVLLGKVTRYRERSTASRPSSVAFELSLYSAPDAKKAWVSSFDETQRALSENIVNARRYPGGGSRWLTAGELARWGIDASVESLPERR